MSTAKMPGGATREVAIPGRLFLDGKAERLEEPHVTMIRGGRCWRFGLLARFM